MSVLLKERQDACKEKLVSAKKNYEEKRAPLAAKRKKMITLTIVFGALGLSSFSFMPLTPFMLIPAFIGVGFDCRVSFLDKNVRIRPFEISTKNTKS